MIKFLEKVLSNERVMKFIKKQITKDSAHLTDRMQKGNYMLYREILSLISNEQKRQEIIFFMVLYLNSKFNSSAPFLKNILSTITDVFVLEDIIYIYAYHPGLIIGKGGYLISELEMSISEKMGKHYMIQIVEDKSSTKYHIFFDLGQINSYF